MMSVATDCAIQLDSVSKTYGNGVPALRGLSLRVQSGHVHGLLGPNGSGKSTLVKILLTLVRPDTCAGTMLGEKIGHNATLRRVGYLPEHVRFPDHLTALELIDFAGRLCCVPSRVRAKRAPELLAMVGMSDWGGQRIGQFSKGMKQRVGLAQALINDPEVVFLDEPTDGVDPVGRRDIREIILALKARNKTVFINSHLLKELEVFCDRVSILKQGNVIREGLVEELTRDSSRYEIVLEGDLLGNSLIAGMAQALGGSIVLEPSGQTTLITIPTRRPQLVQPLIDAAREAGCIVHAVTPVRQSLEDVFIDSMSSAPPIPAAQGESVPTSSNY